MENSKNPTEKINEEKIVPLNEDLSGHVHDKKSFDKIAASQKAELAKMKKSSDK